jgi:hypothetical protein
MCRRDIVVIVLNEVEIFDQEVCAPRPIAEELANVFKRVGVELTSFGKASGPLARANMSCRPIWTAVIRGLLLHAT